MSLHENIYRLRMEKGLTQVELAEQAGISQNAVSLFENGLKTPSVAVLVSFAESLGCSVDELLGRNN